MKMKFFLISIMIFSTVSVVFLAPIIATNQSNVPANVKLADPRINPNNLLWPSYGIPIINGGYSERDPAICCDSNGNAIIVWEEYNRTGNETYDIYAQKINTNGQKLWGDNGIVICNAAGDQSDPKICCLDSGSVLIVWLDNRDLVTTGVDVYAQIVDPNGVVEWNNGTVICNDNADQAYLSLCCNGTNAIIVWADSRDAGDWHIYAQNINSQGVHWTVNGVQITDLSGNDNNNDLCCDGNGGAIITWKNYNGSHYDVYAQRINSTGGLEWTGSGIPIANNAQYQNEMKICCDSTGGAIITWTSWQE